MPKRKSFVILSGKEFGNASVIGLAGWHKNPSGSRHAKWHCLCTCGKYFMARGDSLKSGATSSCGCYGRASSSRKHTIHGASIPGMITPEYMAWINMRSRCRNPKDRNFPRYGGRGISVCERWDASFVEFLSDMGERPSDDHSLDRENNDGNYNPSNCRWATATQQCRNKSSNRMIKHNGETKCQSEWASITGISKSTISKRIRSGWTPGRSLQENPKSDKKLTDDQAQSARDCPRIRGSATNLAKELGVSKTLICNIRNNKAWNKNES